MNKTDHEELRTIINTLEQQAVNLEEKQSDLEVRQWKIPHHLPLYKTLEKEALTLEDVRSELAYTIEKLEKVLEK